MKTIINWPGTSHYIFVSEKMKSEEIEMKRISEVNKENQLLKKFSEIDYDDPNKYIYDCAINAELIGNNSETREDMWEGFYDLKEILDGNGKINISYGNKTRWVVFIILSVWFDENPLWPMTSRDILKIMFSDFKSIANRHRISDRKNNTDTKICHNLKKFHALGLFQRNRRPDTPGYFYSFRKRILEKGFDWFFQANDFLNIIGNKNQIFKTQDFIKDELKYL